MKQHKIRKKIDKVLMEVKKKKSFLLLKASSQQTQLDRLSFFLSLGNEIGV